MRAKPAIVHPSGDKTLRSGPGRAQVGADSAEVLEGTTFTATSEERMTARTQAHDTTPEVATDVRLRAVLTVIGGESLGTVARRYGVEGILLERWYRQFLTAGTAALAHERHAGREETILRFYSRLADETRVALGALGGWVELLAARPSPDDAAEAAASARQILDHLRRLSDDAADSAAAARGEIDLEVEPLDLTALVETVVGADPGVELTAPLPVPVVGDRGRLLQVTAAVVGALRGGNRPLEVVVARHSDWAELRVTTPAPMPFEALEGLFEPFRGTKDMGEGTGLYVCRALVSAHGGELGTHTGAGSTTAWLRLPLADPGETAA